MPRALTTSVLIVLALAPVPRVHGAVPSGGAIEWNFLDQMDADDRALVEAYAETARKLDLLALEIGRRWPTPLLEIQASPDLARVRWRLPGEVPGTWHHAIVCPEDRERLAKTEATVGAWSSPRRWRPLVLRDTRLVLPPAWAGRGLLLTGQGEIVRILAID